MDLWAVIRVLSTPSMIGHAQLTFAACCIKSVYAIYQGNFVDDLRSELETVFF